MKHRILIVVPSFKILGGVANHYMGLASFWKSNVKYCTYGKRPKIPAIFCLLPDLLIYIFKLIFCKIDVVIVNPSLRKYQLRRDAIYLILARIFRKKVVSFIHGWDYSIAEQISKEPYWFKRTYGKSLFIYVLCSDFKKTLDELNMSAPVILTTTKVADSLVASINNKRNGTIKQILFLARVEKNKGIIITLETFALLKQNNPHLKLSVCGTGTALEEAKTYTKQLSLTDDVIFHGNVSGEKLITQFKTSDIYILPTTHGEGMATSVLEAMAFGLPIISRPVGGVKDFFINGEMGYLLESLNPIDYTNAIQSLIDNPPLTSKISQTNETFAKNHFLASKVTEKFENDITTFLNKL